MSFHHSFTFLHVIWVTATILLMFLEFQWFSNGSLAKDRWHFHPKQVINAPYLQEALNTPLNSCQRLINKEMRKAYKYKM
jgi:hypothetical protein